MFKLVFDTDNAAFEPYVAEEVAVILKKVAEQVLNGSTVGRCVDSNGNSVGIWEVG